MKIRVAPRALLLAACILSPPHFGTVLTLPYEPGDWRVLENPGFVLRQRRYSRADSTNGDDKNCLRKHLPLRLTAPPARRIQAPELGQQTDSDSTNFAMRASDQAAAAGVEMAALGRNVSEAAAPAPCGFEPTKGTCKAHAVRAEN